MLARRWPAVVVTILAVVLVAGCTTTSGAPTDIVTVTGTPGVPDTGTTPASPATGAGNGTDSAPSSGAESSPLIPTSTAPTTPVVVPPVARVTADPALGSTGLSPSAPITVVVQRGSIAALTMTNPEGKVLKGSLSADRSTWTLGEVLGYHKRYRVTGTAVGTDGKRVPINGSFTTVTPKTDVRTTISPGDGKTVGVAAPVIVGFAVEPKDRAAIEKRVSISTTPKVDGAWAWIDHDGGEWGLDFRPKNYWPAGTKVHVAANVYGFRFADGAYGAEDLTSDFTIGRNQVVYADANTHEMTVKQDGRTVASYPASLGAGGTDTNLFTRSGIHIVMDFFQDKIMSNPPYYTSAHEMWAVRISDNGEFIHANQGTVGDQGNSNVTHGCINLSTDNAMQYFKSAIYGDPVEITGTPVQLGPTDGDIFDWSVPWSEWVTLSGKNSAAAH